MPARETHVEELRRHALVIGEVTLTSGAVAQYYVDAKRAILRPAGFAALAELVAAYARQWEATAVGGLTMGADAPACAALAGGAIATGVIVGLIHAGSADAVLLVPLAFCGAANIALASSDAPYEALATIDEVYPDRPDK